MNNRITSTVNKFNMLSKGDTVLAGVSGGADSMLMLHYLISVRDSFNLTIKVAHIEHGIRGQASVSDAMFVKSFCESNDIEYHQLSINAVDESEKLGMSVEEYSRNRRYEFFYSIPCDKIATAHNLTDNVETIIMRLARGTGLKGLCGIPPVRGKIIRPLIELSSADIREYCDNNDIPYRVDSTNSCNDYTRNYIRNKILPELSELNSNLESSVSALISDINEDYSFIENYSAECYNSTLDDNKLLKSKLSELDISVQKRVILRYFNERGISVDRFHLNEIIRLILKNGKYQIKGNSFAVSDNKHLRLAQFINIANSFTFSKKILNIEEFIKDNIDFYCDYDKIVGDIIVRARCDGDTISPLGRGCTKSLKKLFNELHIPPEDRYSIPVICDDIGVIAVVGYAVDERVKVDSSTKKILCVEFPLED